MTAAAPTLFLEVSPGETRAALADGDGHLLELHAERLGEPRQLGAIFLGRVARVEQGMDAAFVDIGGATPGFLGKARRLTEGAAIIVQARREAGGGKGPALSASPILSGRYLALDPLRPGISISRRLEQNREAIEAATAEILPDGMGVAARPPVRVADEEMLRAELSRLLAEWQRIGELAKSERPPATLLPAPALAERLLLDAAGNVVIDEPKTFSHLAALAGREMPDLVDSIALYRGNIPLFEAQGIEEQLEAALAPGVSLPGGGGLVIETTEALVAIDVNMGGGGGRLPSETAILKANMVAAREGARQIRLRNLAGLIVIDFISMRNKGNRRKLVDALRRDVRGDPVRNDVLGMTPAGLIEITRQRAGRPLAELFTRAQPCAPGLLAEAEACAALRAALRHGGSGAPVLSASPAVIAALQGPLKPALQEANRRLGRDMLLRAEPNRTSFEISTA